ncbi:MAG: ABC transporter C-terminal domain-containing protein, partial [Wenyingzhuangia sp.]
IENFPGNYSDFRAYENSDHTVVPEIVPTKIEAIKEKKKSPAKLSYLENKEYINLESDISKLNRKKETIETEFSEGKIEGEDIDKKSNELQKIIDDIEFKELRWFELSEKLEE